MCTSLFSVAETDFYDAQGITYKKDLRELVSDLSFVLNDSDKAAVIGEEGNGKFTLLRLIYDESLVGDYVEYFSEVVRNNSILRYLSQELEPGAREKSVYDFLSEEPEFLESEPKELAAYAGKLHIPVSLLYSDQRMDTLSGGEKIKICMVRILCRKPDVLILDEPTRNFSPLSGPVIRKPDRLSDPAGGIAGGYIPADNP